MTWNGPIDPRTTPMTGVHLILALHNHQPVGNFDEVFEASYRDSYLPFLDVMEDYPAIPFVVHTSGPLVEWLVDRHPEYIARVRRMVEAGRVEILGGGFFEPILTMIPHRDRVGQVRAFTEYLADTFGTRIRGAWLAERVWEQPLVSSLVEAGIEYVALDDFHFLRAGVEERDLRGYYLTEEDGRLLKVFPIAERLRYLIPFQEPHDCYEYLRKVAADRPGSTMVFADDGEKLGAWPNTHDHVYRDGWLRRFCDMISGNATWLQPSTFARRVDSSLPVGKIYLPDSSYREMTEWVLPPAKLAEFQVASEPIREATGASVEADDQLARLKPFVRAGGYWRNFKARYAETDEMYARMLGVSNRLDALARSNHADPDYLDVARQDLYRAQCNCPYWHGAFGGLYLPHLRNAVYRHLIAADNALDEAEGMTGPRVDVEVADFNLDARQEVRLSNDQMVALIRPALGGHVYELDFRHATTNLLATLDRRPEAYHALIRKAIEGRGEVANQSPSIMENVVLKQGDLDRRLIYDTYPRKALVDHFFRPDATLEDARLGRDAERGDFVAGTYLARVHRNGSKGSVTMERPGLAQGHAVRVRKVVEVEAGSGTIEVRYALEDLPKGVDLCFGVEINLASMAGHAPDRYYSAPDGGRLGMLDAELDLADLKGISLTDEWLDVNVGLAWSRPAEVWCFPIETVSQSEGGFEGVYQSSAVIPRWVVKGGIDGRWEVVIRWTVEPARPASPEKTSAARSADEPAWSSVDG